MKAFNAELLSYYHCFLGVICLAELLYGTYAESQVRGSYSSSKKEHALHLGGFFSITNRVALLLIELCVSGMVIDNVLS